MAATPALAYDDRVITRAEATSRRRGVMVGEFGDKFRKEREKKGISLEEISNATKISSRMLLAIEDEQFDRLPGGVFNKGFIRAYAKYVGLNEDQAVADYLDCLHKSQLDSEEMWDAQARPGTGLTGANEELPDLQLPRSEHVQTYQHYGLRRESSSAWRLLALAALVIVLAVLVWNRHSRGTRTQAAAPAATSPAQPAPQPTPASTQTAAPVPALRNTAASAAARPSAAKTALVSNTAASLEHRPNPTQPVPTAEPNNGGSASQGLEAQSTPPSNDQATAAPLSLVIRASENSWISVTADGRTILHELLIAPAHTSIHASREISVKIGNAGGVSFVWNGQELPAQGAEGDVKTLIFDESGMRDVTPTPAPAQNP